MDKFGYGNRSGKSIVASTGGKNIMSDIVRVHVHYVDYDKTHRVKTFKPTEQGNTHRLKQDIANVLTAIQDQAEYYYVTIEKEGPDGKPRYATIVKKTFFKE
jgi:hypothetical protein